MGCHTEHFWIRVIGLDRTARQIDAFSASFFRIVGPSAIMEVHLTKAGSDEGRSVMRVALYNPVE
jgi:hypothetical protein